MGCTCREGILQLCRVREAQIPRKKVNLTCQVMKSSENLGYIYAFGLSTDGIIIEFKS